MTDYLEIATAAAREAGAMLREHFGREHHVDEYHAHDIKLALDVRSQQLITDRLLEAFPDHAIFGEEGVAGNQDSEFQWIVDPIDGTVNYFFGIPHFAVSIGLRQGNEMLAGVIYDPMMDELWGGRTGEAARLNGKEIAVSPRETLAEAVVTVGFSKTAESLERGLERYKDIAFKVRKTRMLGSAALGMAYVACGRLDAYIEEQISLWDIAAGLVLVNAAGGSVDLTPLDDKGEKFSIVCSSGKLDLS